MGNLLRTLIFNDEVSLTIADTTEIVREGMRFHGLSPASAHIRQGHVRDDVYELLFKGNDGGDFPFLKM